MSWLWCFFVLDYCHQSSLFFFDNWYGQPVDVRRQNKWQNTPIIYVQNVEIWYPFSCSFVLLQYIKKMMYFPETENSRFFNTKVNFFLSEKIPRKQKKINPGSSGQNWKFFPLNSDQIPCHCDKLNYSKSKANRHGIKFHWSVEMNDSQWFCLVGIVFWIHFMKLMATETHELNNWKFEFKKKNL